MQTTEYVESLDDVNNRSLKQLHGPLCDDYAKLMRMARSKVTPDIVLNSAPGALQLVQLRIAADLVDKCAFKKFSMFTMENTPNKYDESDFCAVFHTVSETGVPCMQGVRGTDDVPRVRPGGGC